jgi:glycosyltransferase involved in cell wall biosynthesis
MDKISIIVPIYNSEDTLFACLQSIIFQTFNNIEIILIDDGSQDKSLEICKAFQRNDNRIKVYSKANGGLSSARNFGLKYATGDYVGFVDSDDTIMNNMYELLYFNLKKFDTKIATCGRVYTINERKKLQFVNNKIEIWNSEFTFVNLFNYNKIDSSVCNKLFHKSLFSIIQFKEGVTTEDIIITPQLLLLVDKIVYVGFPLYVYNYRVSSISNSPKNYFHIINTIHFLENFVNLNFNTNLMVIRAFYNFKIYNLIILFYHLKINDRSFDKLVFRKFSSFIVKNPVIFFKVKSLSIKLFFKYIYIYTKAFYILIRTS